MPVLDQATQAAAEEANAWGHEPIGVLLEEGWYELELGEVSVIGGDNGRWDWVFQVVADTEGNLRSGRQWWTTTTTPDSIGKLKATYEAFDADLDTNTDELLGEHVHGYVVQQVARQGKRKGEVVNSMQAIRAMPTAEGGRQTEGAGARAM
jgi:hypothetical protein